MPTNNETTVAVPARDDIESNATRTWPMGLAVVKTSAPQYYLAVATHQEWDHDA